MLEWDNTIQGESNIAIAIVGCNNECEMLKVAIVRGAMLQGKVLAIVRAVTVQGVSNMVHQ